MKVYDQKTGEIGSMHSGPESANEVDLHDYVDNYKAFDRLYLSRESIVPIILLNQRRSSLASIGSHSASQ